MENRKAAVPPVDPAGAEEAGALDLEELVHIRARMLGEQCAPELGLPGLAGVSVAAGTPRAPGGEHVGPVVLVVVEELRQLAGEAPAAAVRGLGVVADVAGERGEAGRVRLEQAVDAPLEHALRVGVAGRIAAAERRAFDGLGEPVVDERMERDELAVGEQRARPPAGGAVEQVALLQPAFDHGAAHDDALDREGVCDRRRLGEHRLGQLLQAVAPVDRQRHVTGLYSVMGALVSPT